MREDHRKKHTVEKSDDHNITLLIVQSEKQGEQVSSTQATEPTPMEPIDAQVIYKNWEISVHIVKFNVISL